MEALSSLISTVESLDATPVVVAHPYTVQFEVPGLWWPQTAYRSWCASRDILYVDAADSISSSEHSPPSCYHDGVHPNKTGAAAIAHGIAEALIAQGLCH